MPKLPFERDQNFSWDREFDSELHLRNDEENRSGEQPRFDDRLRPEQPEPEPDQHEPELDRHEPQPDRHQPQPDRHEPEPEHGASTAEYREPELEQQPILIWPEDDTPKKSRVNRAVYVALLVLLALVGTIWVLERGIGEPALSVDARPTEPSPAATREPPPLKGVPAPEVADSNDLVASREIGEPPPANPIPNAAAPQAAVDPIVPTPAPPTPPPPATALPPAARPTPAPAPLPPATAPPATAPPATAPSPQRSAEIRETRPAPPDRRLNLEPPARPPYRSIPEPTSPRPDQSTPPPQDAAATTASAAAAPAADVDSGAIRDVLGRYRSAFNALDAQAAHQVWPTVQPGTLDRAFAQLREQSLSFDSCSIAVKGVVAEASCSGTSRLVPKAGGSAAQTLRRRWNFSLRKADEGAWLIQHVEAR